MPVYNDAFVSDLLARTGSEKLNPDYKSPSI